MLHLRTHLKPGERPSPRSNGPLDADGATPIAPWVRTLEDWVVRIPYEATRPEMLVGMGCGALFFQAGRVLGLRGLLGLGLRGQSTVLLGRAAGLASEATGFIAASHGVRRAMGQPVADDWNQLGREWVSMGLFLGVMRSARGIVGRAYGSRGALPTRWQSFNHGLAQQAAMYGATVGTAAAEWSWGWRDYQNKGQLLGESLALLGTFQLAGSLAHRALGRHLTPVEQVLEARASNWEGQAKNPWGSIPSHRRSLANPFGGSLHEGLVFSKSEGESSIFGSGGPGEGEPPSGRKLQGKETAHIISAIGPGEIVRIVNDPQFRFVEKLKEKDVVFEVGGSFSLNVLPRIIGPMNAAVAPFLEKGATQAMLIGRKVILRLDPELNPGAPTELEFTLNKEGFATGSAPASRRKTPPSTRRRPLRSPDEGNDVDALLAEAGTPQPKIDSPRPPAESSLLNIGAAHLPIVVDNFMEFSRKARNHSDKLEQDLIEHDRSVVLKSPIGYKMEFVLRVLNELPQLGKIIGGRSVTFSWVGQTESQIAVKQGDQFVDAANPNRRSRLTPPSDGEGKDNAFTTWEARHLPPIFEDLNHLPALMQAAQADYPVAIHSLILERKTADLGGLRRATEGKVSGMEAGQFWELLVPANSKAERSCVAVMREDGLDWKLSPGSGWAQAERQVLFTRHIVTDPAEIYLHLEAISHAEKIKELKDQAITFQHRGKLTHGYTLELASFIEHALNRYQVRGKKILLTNQEDEPLLDFSHSGHRWKHRALIGNK